MGDWFVYLLECQKGLYCGVTKDIKRRETEHNDPNKQAKAVRRLGIPAKIVYWENKENRSEAMKREYAIKQLSRGQKLKLIGDIDLLPRLKPWDSNAICTFSSC